MKEVIYKNGKEFLITDKEFKEALIKWDSKSPYWCERLECMLVPYYDFVGTPEEELGKKILIDPNNEYKRRYFMKDDQYFEILTSGDFLEVRFNNEKEMESFTTRLVRQDDFYDKKLLLK